MRVMAATVPSLIRVSLFLFFIGLGDSMVGTNTIIGIIAIVPICCCGSFFLCSMVAPNWNLQSPHQNLFSWPIFLIQNFWRLHFGNRTLGEKLASMTMEARQERAVMEETSERKDRDVRAIRWLVNNTTAKAEIEPLVLAIPVCFNTEWGREVWMDLSRWRSNSDTSNETVVYTICQSVGYLFNTCNRRSFFASEEARHRRMRACVEAAVSLVCCTDFKSEWFGDVGKPVSEIGQIEKTNQSLGRSSDPSFTIRWTCLSLVMIRPILGSNRLRVLAAITVSGLARFQSEYGLPDELAWKSAQQVEQDLETAWECVEDLHRAFEPWTQRRTMQQAEEILRNHERQITELERIKIVADCMEDFDWRMSLWQDALDDATHKFVRQLPGVSFDELRPQSESLLIGDIFNSPATCGTPVTPQLIFHGQQAQALARLGLKLREVLDGRVVKGYENALESLKSIDKVPVSLRRPDGLMKRQLWRLQDLRDGGGLGYNVELFFLSLGQLLSIPSSHESESVFYCGTFKTILSCWEESKDSLGTQRVLLNIICDLIIKNRGVFSNVSYPEAVTNLLVDVVGDMVRWYAGSDEDILSALQEIEDVDPLTCMDMRLRHRALAALSQWQWHVVASVS